MYDSNNRKINIANGTKKEEYNGKIIDIIGSNSLSNYGKNVRICATIMNGNDLESGEICSSINVDFTTPQSPVLTSSDSISSGNWHKNNFSINLSGGGTSPSGIYYVFGMNSSTVNDRVSSSKISISEETSGTIYYFKTCNNVGICSNVSTYNVLLDKTPPRIIDFYNSSNGDYQPQVSLTGSAKDELSGITKYKFVTTSSYSNSGWSYTLTTTDSVNLYGTATINGNYYFWVQDVAGNYAYKYINIKNCGTLYTKVVKEYSEISSSIYSDVRIPGILKLESISVDNGYVSSKSLSSGVVSYNIRGGTTNIGDYPDTCTSYPSSYRADKEEYCIRYYCSRGGTLQGSKCVGSTYKEQGRSVSYSCLCTNGKYTNCGGPSITTVYCDEGYRDGGFTMSYAPSNGQSCYSKYSGYRYGIRTCIWGGNYNASCSNSDYSYSCNSGDVLNGTRCYYCSKGTINYSGTSCSYTCYKDYSYWEYQVVIKYYA